MKFSNKILMRMVKMIHIMASHYAYGDVHIMSIIMPYNKNHITWNIMFGDSAHKLSWCHQRQITFSFKIISTSELIKKQHLKQSCDKWATSWENLFLQYANNKDADQPVHPRNLISACVFHCLDSVIPLVSISEISSLYLASVVAQAGLCLAWSQTSKTGFLVTRLK